MNTKANAQRPRVARVPEMKMEKHLTDPEHTARPTEEADRPPPPYDPNGEWEGWGEIPNTLLDEYPEEDTEE